MSATVTTQVNNIPFPMTDDNRIEFEETRKQNRKDKEKDSLSNQQPESKRSKKSADNGSTNGTETISEGSTTHSNSNILSNSSSETDKIMNNHTITFQDGNFGNSKASAYETAIENIIFHQPHQLITIHVHSNSTSHQLLNASSSASSSQQNQSGSENDGDETDSPTDSTPNNNNTSKKSPTTITRSLINDNYSFVEKFKNLPYELQRCLNSSDFHSLKLIIQESFGPDCSFKTSTMKATINGNDKILKSVISIVDGFPDFICTIQKVKYSQNAGTITASMEMSGTNCLAGTTCSTTGNPTGYNCLIDFNPQQRNAPASVKKAHTIHQLGKRFKFLSRAEWIFTLNNEKNKVAHFAVANKILGVVESQD